MSEATDNTETSKQKTDIQNKQKNQQKNEQAQKREKGSQTANEQSFNADRRF